MGCVMRLAVNRFSDLSCCGAVDARRSTAARGVRGVGVGVASRSATPRLNGCDNTTLPNSCNSNPHPSLYDKQ